MSEILEKVVLPKFDGEKYLSEGDKIYARFCGGFGQDLIATGHVKINHGELDDGRKVTYEYADFTWVTDNGYEYYGDIAGWDIVK